MTSRPPKLPHDVRVHFINRLKERFAIELTLKECKQLEKRREGFFLKRQSRSRRWYLLKINERWVYCLYQINFGYTTVLTAEQFWLSHSDVRLPKFHADGRFADAWMTARKDQKKYKLSDRL